MVVAPIPPRDWGPVSPDNVLIVWPSNPRILLLISCIFFSNFLGPDSSPGGFTGSGSNSLFNRIKRLLDTCCCNGTRAL